ncbi:MAG: glycosyltransferase [Planctomycetes bacterium]|nr:glycosyltransferase [Planctomycetota bacterium]
MSAPLRIVVVAHGWPPQEHAGAELAAAWLARGLVERGHAVRAFVRTGWPDLPLLATVRERVDGVAVTRIKTLPEQATSLRGTYLDPGVRAAFERELADGVDVVHFHHTLGLSIDLVEAARQAGARVVFTLHDFWHLCPRGQRYTPSGHLCAEIEPDRCARCIGKKRARYALQRFAREPGRALLGLPRYLAENLGTLAIRRRSAEMLAAVGRADVVTAPSQFVLDEHRRQGLHAPSAVVVANGIAAEVAEALRPREAPGAPLRFGFVGSLLPSKGADLLLTAFRGLVEGGRAAGASGGGTAGTAHDAATTCATLAIHGTSPWDGGAYARRLEEQHRHPAIRFHGRFGREQLADVLGSIDVLVVPSRWYENAPITLDEAALARLPVVVAGHGGMAELLAARGNGLAFRPGDAADLQAALARFLREPGLWQALRTPRVPIPTAAAIAAQFESLYRA